MPLRPCPKCGRASRRGLCCTCRMRAQHRNGRQKARRDRSELPVQRAEAMLAYYRGRAALRLPLFEGSPFDNRSRED